MVNKDLFFLRKESILKKDTDATSSGRGFYYQYLKTLNYWLTNFIEGNNNEIFCETEDDILEFCKTKLEIKFTQVKSYSDGFSLKSPEIKNTLLNFFILFTMYKDDYSGFFHFETNAGTKPNAGKILKDWQKNQDNRDYVIKNFLTLTRELLINFVKKESKEKVSKITDNIFRRKIMNVYSDLEKKINSLIFEDFIHKIRWEFLEIDAKDAISLIIKQIKEKIGLLPKFGDYKRIIFARLLSEVFSKSTEFEIKDRLLNIELLNLILNESIKEIESKISNNVNILMQNDFFILDEIDKLKSIITKSYDILNNEFGNKFSFDEFLKQYKENAIKELSRINFIGLQIPRGMGQNQNVQLKDIFVKPNFQPTKPLKIKYYEISPTEDYMFDRFQEKNKPIVYSKIFDKHFNLVILGSPGSGKSTLVKSIIYKILTKESGEFTNKKIFYFLPFWIELRKYLANKKENKDNIIKYLKRELEDKYYIKNLTFNQVNLIVENYPTIFFFDGLDEIFDTTNKNEIRSDIELFTNSYPNVNSVVTSRILGYDESKLSSEFLEYYIQDFEDNQIREYLNKWYNQYLPGTKNQFIRNEEINSFFEEIVQVDKELITNPLLLSLIVILFSNLKKVPQSKLAIYESCTNTLVDKWDASKKLKIEIEPDLLKYKETIFADLAYWEYEQLSSKNKLTLTYNNAIEKVRSVIMEKLRLVNNYNIAEKQARNFLEYAEKRSLYFENEFTHKTFREFFTAYWIFINLEKKYKVDERNKIISKYISNPFWSIVLELLINMIDEKQADNEIIDELIGIQLNKKNSLYFILDILPKIRNISKDLINKILKKAIYFSISQDSKTHTINKIHEPQLDSLIFHQIEKLLKNKEYFIKIEKVFNEIYDEIKDNNDILLIYYLFYFELFFECSFIYIHEKVALKIFNLSNSNNLDTIAKNNILLFWLVKLYKKRFFEISDYIELIDIFGNDKIFATIPFYFNNARRMGPLARGLNFQLLTNIDTLIDNIKLLQKKGLKLLNLLRHQRHFLIQNKETNFFKTINLINSIDDKEILAYLISSFIFMRKTPNNEITNQNMLMLGKVECNSKYLELIKFSINSDMKQNPFDKITRILSELGLPQQ